MTFPNESFHKYQYRIFLLHGEVKKLIPGWGNGSVGEAFAVQKQGKEFEFPQPR